MMTNGDPEKQNFSIQITDSFSCSPFNTAFYVYEKLSEVTEYAEMRHVMMASH